MAPPYALLGATGTAGQTILRVLLQDPQRKIHALVRSPSKLRRLFPDLDSSPNVTVFEGAIKDLAVLERCLTGTVAAFLAVASSVNMPNCRIAQDQCEAVVSALTSLRDKNPNVKPPTLIVLSSAETEQRFSQEVPWPVRPLLFAANSNIYLDLMQAEKFLRKNDDWLSAVFVKPGGLSHDIARGHIISTEKDQTFLSYLDLANAMVEIAETEGGKWDGKTVSVLSHGKANIEWWAPLVLTKGLLVHYFPGLFPWIS